MLCKALMGPVPQGDFASPTFAATPNHDGAEGFGFRVPPRSGVFRSSGNKLASGANEMAGKTYGPYLNPSQFHVSNTYSPKGTAAQAPKRCGLDPMITSGRSRPSRGTSRPTLAANAAMFAIRLSELPR